MENKKYEDKNQNKLKCNWFKLFLATSLATKPDETGDKNISVVTTDVEPVEKNWFSGEISTESEEDKALTEIKEIFFFFNILKQFS